ncbi:MAG: SpoIIE family protein phosphatase [Acidobacteria bacterium]|nr:SpoIIE family protein phosphatase [Acidobacteriota bacterium]
MSDFATPAQVNQMISDLSVEFISILDLDELIERIARRVSEVINFRFFNLLLVDESRGGLVWKKTIGYPPEEVERHRLIPFDRSIASAAVRAGHSIIVDDLLNDHRNLRVPVEGDQEPRSEIAVPLVLVSDRRVVGVLTLESVEPGYFNRDHERLLSVLGNQLAIALEHARLYDELRQRTREMKTLIEIGHEITSILDLDRLLNHIAPLLDRVINYEFLLVGLIDEAREEIVWHVEEGYGVESRARALRMPVCEGIVGRAVRERRTQIVGDVANDPDYYVDQSWRGLGQQSEIAVPLIYEERVIGIIALESSRLNAFNEYHARLLESIANHLSIAVVNARLYAEHVERERRLEREILMARDVQRAMIPESPPVLKGFEIAARLEPALNLSGDFYDYVPLSDKRLGLMVGDVSGKGVRAAMGMAASRSLLRSVSRRGHGPSRVLRDANLRLYRDLGKQLLLTLVYGVLEAETRTFQYCNAGHNAPVHIKASGRWRTLRTGGLLMGVFDKQQYKSETVHLERGDLLFFYTDGLVEAHTPAPERLEYGEGRLLDLLLANRHLKAAALLDLVMNDVNAFSAGAHQHDDITVVVVRVL